MTDTARPVIRLIGAALTYPGPPPTAALRPTDFTVFVNDYVAVTGPSGSGKSTLLNVLGLLDRPTEGIIEFDGVDVTSLQESAQSGIRARHIGFIFQDFHLLAHRTAIENVALARLYTDRHWRNRIKIAADALDRVGLGHRLNALPRTMSGGERQRVAIARALAAEPSILLCDEPTGNLDTDTAGGVLALIDDLHDHGISVVMITHDFAVAARAQRRLVIRDGVVNEVSHA